MICYSSSSLSIRSQNRFNWRLPLRFRIIAACFSCCSSTSVIQHLFLPHISKLGAHTIRTPVTRQQSSDPWQTSDLFLHEDDSKPLKENNRYWRKNNWFLSTYDAVENNKTKSTNITRLNFILYQSENEKNNHHFVL